MSRAGKLLSVLLPAALVVAACEHRGPAVVTLAAPRATARVAEKPVYDLTGRWRGRYFHPPADYEGRSVVRTPPVEFVIDIAADGRQFIGRLTEPNTFGDATSERLRANVRGEFFTDNKIVFDKIYDGTGGVGHTVMYEGHLSPDTGEVRGRWHMPGMWSGTFEMEKQGESEGEITFPPHEHRRDRARLIWIPVDE